ncbi:MAG: hypothetical protein OK439_06970 [Thaumarchaeota archaeon]|nr:hypothetical protein [Nitrososphaerota archaeon]
MNSPQRYSRFPSVFSRNWKKFVYIGIVEIILVSLAIWTIVSPSYLVVQDPSQISDSLFQFAKVREVVNFVDGEGTYAFLFGMDFNNTLSHGIPTIVEVFASLITQHSGSAFIKGVALEVIDANVLIDGVQNSGVNHRFTYHSNILIDYLSFVQNNDTSGSHSISVRLIVSTSDVNYIGYFSGTEQVVSLNGTIAIV